MTVALALPSVVRSSVTVTLSDENADSLNSAAPSTPNAAVFLVLDVETRKRVPPVARDRETLVRPCVLAHQVALLHAIDAERQPVIDVSVQTCVHLERNGNWRWGIAVEYLPC